MSKEVKRYGMCGFESGIVEMEDGPYVDADDYDALLAERDALRKDAERYQHLVECGRYTPSAFGGWGMRMCGESATKAELDAAIDRAMQGEQP